MSKKNFSLSESNTSAFPAVSHNHLNAAMRALEYAWPELDGDPVAQSRLKSALIDFITMTLETALREKDVKIRA